MQPRETLGSASELATSRSVIHFCGLQALWVPAGSLGNWEVKGLTGSCHPPRRRTPFQNSERGEAAWNLGHGVAGCSALQSVPFSSLAAPSLPPLKKLTHER